MNPALLWVVSLTAAGFVALVVWLTIHDHRNRGDQ